MKFKHKTSFPPDRFYYIVVIQKRIISVYTSIFYTLCIIFKIVLFFLAFLKTTKNFDLPNTPATFTFPSNKILKLEIEALFQLLIVYTDTKTKKNKTYHCKINTFIASLKI